MPVQTQVADAKRSGEYDLALSLCLAEMEKSELHVQSYGGSVDSWPYRDAAIVYRKLKRYDDEIAVLERFAQQPASGSKQSMVLYERMAKAYQLAGREGDPLQSLLFEQKALILDTETTGLAGYDEIIEFAGILFTFNKVTGKAVKILDRYASLREPSIPIPPAATDKHGLTDADVRGHNLDSARVSSLYRQADILIAYNASFDRRMLASLYPEVQGLVWYCPMNAVNWRAKGTQDKKLETVLTHYDLLDEQEHRALGDVQAMYALLQKADPETGLPFFHEMLMKGPMGKSSGASRPQHQTRRQGGSVAVVIRAGEVPASQEPKKKRSCLWYVGVGFLWLILVSMMAAPLIEPSEPSYWIMGLLAWGGVIGWGIWKRRR